MNTVLYTYVLAGVILRMSALQNGDLRLTNVVETTLGINQSGNKSVIYMCRTQDEEPLQKGNQESCLAARAEGHGLLHPVFQDTENISACTSPWSQVENGCYRLIQNPKPWKGLHKIPRKISCAHEEARQECNRMGGDLAKILDKGTNQGLMRMVPRSAWFLANDIDREGQWQYDANQTLTFMGWAKHEPNNLGGEDCASIDEKGDWYDARCQIYLFFLCSKKHVKVRVRCNGTETSLDQCFLGEVDYLTCWDSDKVMIGCTYTHQVEGTDAVSSYQGFLQIYLNNQWRFLCDRKFGMKESKVACEQLNRLPHKLFKYSIENGERILMEYKAGCDTGLQFARHYTDTGKGQFGNDNHSVKVGCLETEQSREGFYGDDCSRMCGHCAGGSCSGIDGSCPSGRCETGYTGPGCMQAVTLGGGVYKERKGINNTTGPETTCMTTNTWMYPVLSVACSLVLLSLAGVIFQCVYFKHKKSK